LLDARCDIFLRFEWETLLHFAPDIVLADGTGTEQTRYSFLSGRTGF
jgi:hypothetical protein